MRLGSKMITERDNKILFFLNDFGFARSSIIADLLFSHATEKSKKQICFQRLKRLFSDGLLLREKEFRFGEFIYRLSRKGAAYLNEIGHATYPVLVSMGWRGIIHSDYILQVFIYLRKKSNFNFYSERDLRNKKYFNKHVPDLVVQIDQNTFYAFEIEVEQKSNERLLKKFKEGNSLPSIEKIVYICTDRVPYFRIKKLLGENKAMFGKFEVYQFDDFLHNDYLQLDRIIQSQKLKEVQIG
jgi:hypothetical protein